MSCAKNSELSRSLITIITLALLVVVQLGCRNRSSGDNSCDEQKQVVLYCSVDQSVAEPIIREFENFSGIKVLARFDTEASKTVGLVQKIRAESAAPLADVFWSGEIFHTIRMAREGLLEGYSSDRTEKWPGQFADPEGRWYAFALRCRVIGYNTNRVTVEEAPKSLEDLLDEKWEGKLVMATPQFGTTGGDVASWFVHYGEERGAEILRRLKENQVRIVAGNSTAVRMVASGQADICLTDTDDVYAGQRNEWPVALHPHDQAGKGALAIPNTAALIKNAPHPEAAKMLMEFLLSDKLEEMLLESYSHNIPVNKTIDQLPESLRKFALGNHLEIDYQKVADQLPVAIETAGGIFR